MLRNATRGMGATALRGVLSSALVAGVIGSAVTAGATLGMPGVAHGATPSGSTGPVASAGSPQSVVAGSTVVLDATASTATNAPLSYAWTETAGPPVALSDAHSATPNFVATSVGTDTFQLTVVDGKGSSATATTTVTVSDPGIVVRASGSTAGAGLPDVLSATVTSALSSDTHTASVDWGDGSPAQSVALTESSGAGTLSVAHAYATPGTYTATVHVSAAGGATASASATMTVTGATLDAGSIWASSTAGNGITWSGGSASVEGRVHSNSGIVLSGASKSFSGPVEYATTLNVHGHAGAFATTPVKVAPSAPPVVLHLADYQPGGFDADAAGSAYHDMTAACSGGTWSPSGAMAGGLYYVPCNIAVPGSSLTGTVTIVATGSIAISGAEDNLQPYLGGLGLASFASPGAIAISGAQDTFGGYLYDPSGSATISGAQDSYAGIIASTVSISGAQYSFTAAKIPLPPSATEVSGVVPRLQATSRVDKTNVSPGDSLTYTAQVTNAGASATVAGAMGATNMGQAPATATGYSLSLLRYSTSAAAWIPLAAANVSSAGTPQGLTVTPSGSSGVSYPTNGDPVSGTTAQPGATAAWSFVWSLPLSPAQLVALASPDTTSVAVDAFVTWDTGSLVAPLVASPGNLASSFGTSASTLTGASIGCATPAGVATIGSSTLPALASIAPGTTVSVTDQATVPVPLPRAPDETDASYAARLAALDTSVLNGDVAVIATTPIGTLSALPPATPSTEHVPVLSLSVSGPTSQRAGSTATFAVSLGNASSASATTITVIDTFGGQPVTLSGAPATLAAGGTAQASAAYAIPVSATSGPTEDTAVLTWQDANGNTYGPLRASTSVNVRSNVLAGAVLRLTVTPNGLEPTGSTRVLTAVLTSSAGDPVANQHVTATITGANPETLDATTDATGTVDFTVAGSNAGADNATAYVGPAGYGVQSGSVSYTWLAQSAPAAITSVTGNFYAEPSGQTSFAARPGDHPAFSEQFSQIDFNPPSGVLAQNTTGVGSTTTPFTDVITDATGRSTGTIPAEGNGQVAGQGALSSFDAVLRGSVSVNEAGDITFNVYANAGWILGMGGGAQRVSGAFENNPASFTSAFYSYPVIGSYDEPSSETTPQQVTVHFLAAGVYPFEFDYFAQAGQHQSLVLTTASLTPTTTPVSVYVGYADGFHPGGSGFPYPWLGAPGVVSVGCVGSCLYDGGGIRIDNNTTSPMSVDNLTATFDSPVYGNCEFAIWPHDITVPPREIAVFGQMVSGAGWGCQNYDGTFDTSDIPPGSCSGNSGTIPRVVFTVNGVTSTYTDSTQVLDTGGFDKACVGNEDHPWLLIGGSASTINVVVPPAFTLTVGPAIASAQVGSSVSETVTAEDAAGTPISGLPITVEVRGPNTQVQRAVTDASGQATVSYVGQWAGIDQIHANAVYLGLGENSNDATVDWTPAPRSPPASGPHVTGLSPNEGPASGGTSVAVSGTGFTGATEVFFGQRPAASFTVNSSTSITAVDPAAPSASVNTITGVEVVTPVGSSAASSDDEFTWQACSIGGSPPTCQVVSSGGGSPPSYPSVGSVSVPDGTRITAPTPISALITAPSGAAVATWAVTVQAQTGGPVTTVADGTGTPPATLGTVDPTLLDNGTYELSVTATTTQGASQTDTVSIVVDGALKLGRFAEDFTDLSVPAGPVSLQVGRRSDSYDKTQGDFGVGWKLAVSGFSVTTNGPLGEGGWTEEDVNCGVVGCQTAFSSSQPHNVTVDWPDGHQEVFQLTPKGMGSLDPSEATAAYTAMPGTDTTSTLAPADSGALAFFNDGNLYPEIDPDPYDPTQFVLTAKNGYKYLLSTTQGLLQETDPNGNTITVSPSGITSSLGPSVSFVRDSEGRITSVTGPDEEKLSYTYSPSGDLATSVDANGNTTSYSYDANHDLTNITGPGGPLYTLHYDSSGRLTSLTDADGNTTSISTDVGQQTQILTDPASNRTIVDTFDNLGDLVSSESISGSTTQTTTYTYDSLGHLTSRTDPKGDTWSGTYDAAGNLTSETGPTGATTSIAYGTDAQPTSITGPDGGVTTYVYDASGNLTSSTDPNGHTTTYAYNSEGEKTSSTDALGHTTTYSYTSAGNLASVTDPNGHTTSYTYDADGHRLTTTDPLGAVTTNAYDAKGNVISTTDPDGNKTTYAYDALGHLVSTTDPLGRVTTDTYDGAGNLTSSTVAGATTSYTYDADGRLLTTTNPLGAVTTNVYDAFGNLVLTTDPDGHTTTYTYNAAGQRTSMTDAAGHTTTYSYDGAGHLTGTTNPDNATTTQSYDPAGRLTQITDALGGTVKFTYDASGNMLTTTDPDGHVTTDTYTAANQLATSANPATGTTSYAYDASGNKVSETNGNGQSVTFTYNAANELTGESGPGVSLAWSYDAAGRQVSATGSTGTTTKTYDAAGELTADNTPQGNLAWTYGANGQPATMTLPTGGVVTYGYNTANELTSLKDPAGGSYALSYDAAGNRTGITYPNGINQAETYTPDNQVASITDALGSSTVASFAYTYGAAGNRTSETGPQGDFSFGYDTLGRLTSSTSSAGTTNYSFDQAGNLTKIASPSGTTTLSYNAAGQLTSAGSQAFGYDAAGNRTSAGSSTFAYDALGQMTSSTVSGATTGYAYNADGLRVTSTTGSTMTPTVWDSEGGAPEPVLNGSQSLIYAGSTPLEQVSGSTTDQLLTDALGSVRDVTDPMGSTIGSSTYNPFGTVASTTGTTSALGYTGAITDPTGLVYDQARYYSPTTAQFTTPDTVIPNAAGSQGYNLYAYTAGNPETFTDPSGHMGLSDLGTAMYVQSQLLWMRVATFLGLAAVGGADAQAIEAELAAEADLAGADTGSLQIVGSGFSASEQSAAEALAAQGRNVVLREATGVGRTSDLLVDGVPYDVYTPTTGNLDRIVSAIASKGSQVNGGGVVLDLSKSPLSGVNPAALLARVQGVTPNISNIIILGG